MFFYFGHLFIKTKYGLPKSLILASGIITLWFEGNMSRVHNHLAHACHVCSTSVDSAILKVYPAKYLQKQWDFCNNVYDQSIIL